MVKYTKCRNCGEVHYIVTKAEADIITKEKYLVEDFSNRALNFCSHCGSKEGFSEVTKEYMEDHSDGGFIQPILLNHEKPTTTKEP